MIITILAGGQGKRMQSVKSNLPKVLHTVDDIPMIVRIVSEANKLNPSKIIIVVGKYHNIIKLTLESVGDYNNIVYANQLKIMGTKLGTGAAVESTIGMLDKHKINIILNGDTPLLKNETIRAIYNHFIASDYKLQITTIKLDNPFGNGRIIIADKEFEKIVEEKDCTAKEKQIKLVNVGIYIATTNIIADFIPIITNNNAQNEYYLTDIVELCKQRNLSVGMYELNQSKVSEIFNVNTKEQLEYVRNILPSQIL